MTLFCSTPRKSTFFLRNWLLVKQVKRSPPITNATGLCKSKGDEVMVNEQETHRTLGKNATHTHRPRSHLSKPWLDVTGSVSPGELLRAERHTFHPTPIRRDPREAHNEVLAVVRACCVALDAYPGARPPHRFDRLVMLGELRRHGRPHVGAQTLQMAVNRCGVYCLFHVRRREAAEVPLKGRSTGHAERSKVDGVHCSVAPVLLILLVLRERTTYVFIHGSFSCAPLFCLLGLGC